MFIHALEYYFKPWYEFSLLGKKFIPRCKAKYPEKQARNRTLAPGGSAAFQEVRKVSI
jgi:hypothetical protein